MVEVGVVGEAARHGLLCDLLGVAPREVAADQHEQTVTAVRLLKKVMNPQGFNVGLNLGRAAGAGVPGHLHWHVVPRWLGDVNFMPVVADTKVISQSLEALYDLVREELRGEPGA